VLLAEMELAFLRRREEPDKDFKKMID